MKRSSFLKRAVGVGVALTTLDGVKLEKLFTERDDAAFIQGLVDKSRRVFLPAGEYTLKRPVVLKPNTWIVGGNGGPTILKMHPENKDYLFHLPGGNGLSNLFFSDTAS